MIRNIYIILLLSIINAELIHPPNGGELTYVHVLFEWEEVPEATGYEFQLSGSNYFSTPLVITNTSDLFYIEMDNINWESNYYWRVRANAEEWMGPHEFSTGESSVTFQNDDKPIEILTYNSQLASNGITVFGSYYNNYSAAIDMNGNEVWNSGGSNSVVFFNLDKNNSFLGGKYSSFYPTTLFGAEFSRDGEFPWIQKEELTFNVSKTPSFTQHEIIKLPNGNYMGFMPVIELHPVPSYANYPEHGENFSWESHLYNLWIYTETGSDYPWQGAKIVEWNKDTNEIIWEWNPFDTEYGYSLDDFDYKADHWQAANDVTTYDWLHFNALAFDSSDNAVYVSSRHLDRISKIDYDTKEIIWNMGIQWYGDEVIQPKDITDNTLKLFSGQHGLQLLPNGNIVTLDNGLLSQLINEGLDYPVSRAIEIKVLEENSGEYSAEEVWSYTLAPELYSALSGNVQKLSNGNYLINTIGTEDGGNSLEVTESGIIVWECKYHLGAGDNGYLYRAMRIEDDCADFSRLHSNVDFGEYLLDHCDICDNDISNDCIQDCLDIWGGTAIEDECGICDGLGAICDGTCPPDGYCDCMGNVNLGCGCGVAGPIDDNYGCDGSCILEGDADSDGLCDGVLYINKTISPEEFYINKIYPNPFNPIVNINYSISELNYISIQIFNLYGQHINTLYEGGINPGNHLISWNGSQHPSGIYFIILENDEKIDNQKVILLK